jgi:hypothetical protein
VQSAAFNAKTCFVRLHTDAVCSLKFGTNPTASATTARIAAGQTEYHGVPVDRAYKVVVDPQRMRSGAVVTPSRPDSRLVERSCLWVFPAGVGLPNVNRQQTALLGTELPW